MVREILIGTGHGVSIMLKIVALVGLLAVGSVMAHDAGADVEYLLTSSAADFHAHPSPASLDFRDVKLAHITAPNGNSQAMICGEFLAQEEGAEPVWQAFLTIRTSKYEQWLGAQAQALCNDRKRVDYDGGPDLSNDLKSRVMALR
ncbi:MAG: hypothetical protein GAK28_02193 [Luteibacter sp.]|uniref:hypothetical protein n=1 Tax=Luteibacter sp. TaxID=1886636 RepID=UPI001383313C|nr:hypothetical protein [Luteibacter sp.]KAF1006874.1 MAG: hypothetical protein GAK28_02193 [Luteibacter sp.]